MGEIDSEATMISVIVCTIERPDQLLRCLSSILACDHPNFEIIVADQSDDDANSQMIAGLADPRVRLLKLDRAGKTHAANAAVARARGQILAFTDDDCEVSPGWLRRADAVLKEEPAVGLVFGTVMASPHDHQQTYVTTFAPSRFRRFRSTEDRSSVRGMGCNMVIRRDVFNRIGGFDEDLGPGARFPCAEDTDYAYRALRRSTGVAQDPASVVVHHARRDYADGAARCLVMTYSYGLGACYARHVRRGDWYAALFLMRELMMVSGEVLWNALRGRKPVGARRAAYWLLGAADAVRRPSR